MPTKVPRASCFSLWMEPTHGGNLASPSPFDTMDWKVGSDQGSRVEGEPLICGRFVC